MRQMARASYHSTCEQCLTSIDAYDHLYSDSQKLRVSQSDANSTHRPLGVLTASLSESRLLLKETTRLCPYILEPTRLCPDTIVPRPDCAHTRLCPDTIVPTHVCAQTRLCPHTCLCPDTFVPWHVIIVWSQSCLGRNMYVCAQTRLCTDTYLVPWQADML